MKEERKKNMGSISIRRFIRWPPAFPQEPTSTIVLTSPGRRFVDLRILDPTPAEAAAEEWQQQQRDLAENNPDGDSGAKNPPPRPPPLPVTRLDWAIAGTSSSWTRTNGEGEGEGEQSGSSSGGGGREVRCSRWTHWIDSRVPAGTDPITAAADEADMYPQPDGTTLEKGRMVNPATGVEAEYEELWADEEPGSIPGASDGYDPDGGRPRRGCVVLELEDERRSARGLIAVLGRYCQGLVRVGDAIGAQRWRHVDGEDGDEGGGGGWRAEIVVGSLDLPCEQAVLQASSSVMEVGQALRHGEDVWRVVESS